MPRPPSADSVLRNMKKQEQKFESKTPIADEMFLPNQSGDHSAGHCGTPLADTDIANKKYVDDNTGLWETSGGNTQLITDDDILMSTTYKIMFRDSDLYIHSDVDGTLRLRADNKLNFMIGGTTIMELSPAGINASNQKIINLTDPTNDQDAATKKYVDDGLAGIHPYVCLKDIKNLNTAGGTFTSGATRTRVLNTEESDDDNICTLSSNQFVLSAGTYRIMASAPAWHVQRHQAILYNLTDATTLLIGTCAYCANSSTASLTRSFIVGQFTVGAGKTLFIGHKCQTTKASDGFGVASNLYVGLKEVYTIVELWKLA